MRALIVDDDPASRFILTSHLAGVADCLACASGVEAVTAMTQALAADQPFDVVFLDRIMPHLDGHETLLRIRQTEREAGRTAEQAVRVIMVTSMDNDDPARAALADDQVAALLAKPPNKQVLLDQLRALDLL